MATQSLAQSTPSAGTLVFRGEYSSLIIRVPSRNADGTLRLRQPDLGMTCNGSLLVASEAMAAPQTGPVISSDASALLTVAVIADGPADVGCDRNWTLARFPDQQDGRRSLTDESGGKIREIILSVDGAVIAAEGVERHPLHRQTAGVLVPTTRMFERFGVPIGAVAPRSTSEAPSLSVAISYESGGPADVIEVPWESIRDLWQAEFEARVTMIRTPLPVVTLPTPQAAVLREAAGALATAATATDAIRQVTRLANASELSRPDRTWARAQSALAFAVANDTLGMRLTMTALLEEEPCFRWSSDAPAPLSSLTSRLASTTARCQAVSSLLVAGRAMIAPGFARPALRDGRRRARAAVTAVVLGSLIVGQWQNSVALDHFATYESAQILPPSLGEPQPNVRMLYRRADHTRSKALAATAFGLGIWIAHGAYEVLAERRFATRLEETANVGAGQRGAQVGWRPAVELSPGRATLGLRYTW